MHRTELIDVLRGRTEFVIEEQYRWHHVHRKTIVYSSPILERLVDNKQSRYYERITLGMKGMMISYSPVPADGRSFRWIKHSTGTFPYELLYPTEKGIMYVPLGEDAVNVKVPVIHFDPSTLSL